ncbi:hypothetical protein DID78_05960 [Candidatus Marinamargulisbacteria bacterium SCGC AG-343-D04]|nr:hypothetical protein DID78_05960 [Candidatus Marinamargulisbacteria bacterium SCGC AG-343-D04]
MTFRKIPYAFLSSSPRFPKERTRSTLGPGSYNPKPITNPSKFGSFSKAKRFSIQKPSQLKIFKDQSQIKHDIIVLIGHSTAGKSTLCTGLRDLKNPLAQVHKKHPQRSFINSEIEIQGREWKVIADNIGNLRERVLTIKDSRTNEQQTITITSSPDKKGDSVVHINGRPVQDVFVKMNWKVTGTDIMHDKTDKEIEKRFRKFIYQSKTYTQWYNGERERASATVGSWAEKEIFIKLFKGEGNIPEGLTGKLKEIETGYRKETSKGTFLERVFDTIGNNTSAIVDIVPNNEIFKGLEELIRKNNKLKIYQLLLPVSQLIKRMQTRNKNAEKNKNGDSRFGMFPLIQLSQMVTKSDDGKDSLFKITKQEIHDFCQKFGSDEPEKERKMKEKFGFKPDDTEIYVKLRYPQLGTLILPWEKIREREIVEEIF